MRPAGQNGEHHRIRLSPFHPQNTRLCDDGVVKSGASKAGDELLIAVSRLFLDNVEHIQSWVKYGDEFGLEILNCGVDDFMGTILSEEITKQAGGEYGECRSFRDNVDMLSAIGCPPVKRNTDYSERRRIDPDDKVFSPDPGVPFARTPLLG